MFKINAYAKINLTLELLGKLPDGYHEISSIMQQIDLCDELEFNKSDQIKVICNEPIPEEQNIVYRALMLLRNRYSIGDGDIIKVTKKIPIGAGLGGGSSDAAAAIEGLNKLWKLKLSNEQMAHLSSNLGMDVAFFINKGTCLATGRGDKVKKIKSCPKMDILIVNPGFKINTKDAYSLVQESDCGPKFKTESMIRAIEKNDFDGIAGSLHNDFERIIYEKYPVIGKIKNEILDNKAANALLSGSGSSVFGIYKKKTDLDEAYERLKNKYKFVMKTCTK